MDQPQVISRLQSRADNSKIQSSNSEYRQLFSDKLHSDTKNQTFLTFLDQSNNIFNLQQQEGVSGVELYVNAATQALNSLEQYDSQATLIISQVIDFLVTDDKLRPKEIVQLKQNIQSLQDQQSVTQNSLEEAVAKKEFFKAESDLYKFRLVSAEDELYKVQLDYESLLKEQNGYVEQINKLQQDKIQIQQDTQHSKQQFNKSAQRQTHLVQEMTFIRSKLENATAEIQSKELKISHLNEQIFKHLKENQTLEDKVHTEIEKKKAQDLKRVDQISGLQNQILELQLQINDLHLNITKKETQINSQNGQIQFQQQQIQSLQQQKQKNNSIARQITQDGQFSSSNLTRNMSFMKREASYSQLDSKSEKNIGSSRNASIQVVQFYDYHKKYFQIGDYQELEKEPQKLFDMVRKGEKQINLTELSEQEDLQIQQVFEPETQYIEQILSKFSQNPLINELKQSINENYVSVQQFNDLKSRDVLLLQKYQKYKNMYTQLKMDTDLQKLKAKQDQIQKTVIELDQIILNSKRLNQDSQGDLILQINDLKQQNLNLMKKNENKFNIYTHVVNSMKAVAREFQTELDKTSDDNQKMSRKDLVEHLLQTANSQLIKTVTSFEDIPDVERVNLENFTKNLLPDLREQQSNKTTARKPAKQPIANQNSTLEIPIKPTTNYIDAEIQCELITNSSQVVTNKNLSITINKNEQNISSVKMLDFGVQINFETQQPQSVSLQNDSQQNSNYYSKQNSPKSNSMKNSTQVQSTIRESKVNSKQGSSYDDANQAQRLLEDEIGTHTTSVQTIPVLMILQINQEDNISNKSQEDNISIKSQENNVNNQSQENILLTEITDKSIKGNNISQIPSNQNNSRKQLSSKQGNSIRKQLNQKQQSIDQEVDKSQNVENSQSTNFNLDNCSHELKSLVIAIAKRDPNYLLQASIPPILHTTEVQTDICELLNEIRKVQTECENIQTIDFTDGNAEQQNNYLCIRCQQQLLDEQNTEQGQDYVQYELRGEKIDETALKSGNSSNDLKNQLLQQYIKQKADQDLLQKELLRLQSQQQTPYIDTDSTKNSKSNLLPVKQKSIQVNFVGIDCDTQYIDPNYMQNSIQKKMTKLLTQSSRKEEKENSFVTTAVNQSNSLIPDTEPYKGPIVLIEKPQFDNLDAKLLLSKQDKLDDITVVKLNADKLFHNQEPIESQRAKIEQQIKAGIKQKLPKIDSNELFINTEYFVDDNQELDQQIEYEIDDTPKVIIQQSQPQINSTPVQEQRDDTYYQLKVEKVEQKAKESIKELQNTSRQKKPVVDIQKLKKQQQDQLKNKQENEQRQFEQQIFEQAEKQRLEKASERQKLENEYQEKLEAIQNLDIERKIDGNKYYDTDQPKFVIKKSNSPNKLIENEKQLAGRSPSPVNYYSNTQYNMQRNIYRTTDQVEPDCSILISYSKKQLQEIKDQVYQKQAYKNLNFFVNLDKFSQPKEYKLENNKFISPYEAALNYRRQLKKLINKQRQTQKYVKYDELASQQQQRLDRYQGSEAVKMMNNQMDMFKQNQQSHVQRIKLIDKTQLFKDQIMKNIFTLSKVVKNLQVLSSFDSMVLDNNVQVLLNQNIPPSQLNIQLVRSQFDLSVNDNISYIAKLDSLAEIIDINLFFQKQFVQQLIFDTDKKITFVQLPPDIQIKPEQWIVKFIRQMFFEMDYHSIFSIKAKNPDFTFAKFLSKYILDKFGIKKLSSRFLWTIIINTQYWVDQQSSYYHEIEIFRLFLSNILDIETLIYYKYCRNLYELDNTNPATLTLYQATKPQVLNKQEIVDRAKMLFSTDLKSFAVFSSKTTNSVHFALLILTAYYSEKRTSNSQQIIKLFKKSTNQDTISLTLAHQILSKLFPTITTSQLEYLTENREINIQLFCQIYETLQQLNASDSLIKDTKNKITQSDEIVAKNNIYSPLFEELRNNALILLQGKKYLAAMISAQNYFLEAEKATL